MRQILSLILLFSFLSSSALASTCGHFFDNRSYKYFSVVNADLVASAASRVFEDPGFNSKSKGFDSVQTLMNSVKFTNLKQALFGMTIDSTAQKLFKKHNIENVYTGEEILNELTSLITYGPILKIKELHENRRLAIELLEAAEYLIRELADGQRFPNGSLRTIILEGQLTHKELNEALDVLKDYGLVLSEKAEISEPVKQEYFDAFGDPVRPPPLPST